MSTPLGSQCVGLLAICQFQCHARHCQRLSLPLGDVQPFIAYGVALQRYGHRVRLATHGCFSQFVRDSGLEFYSIGGDPTELMAVRREQPRMTATRCSLAGLSEGACC